MIRRFILLMLVCSPMACRAASDPVEGLWRIIGSSLLVRVVAVEDDTDRFEIVWEDGDDLSVVPGTVVGTVRRTPRIRVYDCQSSLDPSKGGKKNYGAAHFVIRIDKEAVNMTFEPYEQSTTIDVRRVLPWWLRRISVRKTDTRPKGLDGARRVGAPPLYLSL